MKHLDNNDPDKLQNEPIEHERQKSANEIFL